MATWNYLAWHHSLYRILWLAPGRQSQSRACQTVRPVWHCRRRPAARLYNQMIAMHWLFQHRRVGPWSARPRRCLNSSCRQLLPIQRFKLKAASAQNRMHRSHVHVLNVLKYFAQLTAHCWAATMFTPDGKYGTSLLPPCLQFTAQEPFSKKHRMQVPHCSGVLVVQGAQLSGQAHRSCLRACQGSVELDAETVQAAFQGTASYDSIISSSLDMSWWGSS